MHALIADAILVLHAGFVLFVVGGEACVIIGYFRGWHWVYNRAFRIGHLLAIAIVAAQAWARRICPLTILESRLREAAGQESYTGSFVGHWVGRLVYHDAPLWVFNLVYSLFAILVVASWFWVRPKARVKQEVRRP